MDEWKPISEAELDRWASLKSPPIDRLIAELRALREAARPFADLDGENWRSTFSFLAVGRLRDLLPAPPPPSPSSEG